MINQIHRLMKADGLKSQRGYREPRVYAGIPSMVSANTTDGEYDMKWSRQLVADRNAHAIIPPRKNSQLWKDTR